jgi:hypothetical protein
MKKGIKKLNLNRETLHRLEGTPLQIAGGYSENRTCTCLTAECETNTNCQLSICICG